MRANKGGSACVPSASILVAFCSDIPLICSRFRLGLWCVSNGVGLRRAIMLDDRSRISHRLDGVEARIDDKLDIPSRQTGDALSLEFRLDNLLWQDMFTSRAESGVGAPGPPAPPSSWPDCERSASSALIVASNETATMSSWGFRTWRVAKTIRWWRGYVCVQFWYAKPRDVVEHGST